MCGGELYLLPEVEASPVLVPSPGPVTALHTGPAAVLVLTEAGQVCRLEEDGGGVSLRVQDTPVRFSCLAATARGVTAADEVGALWSGAGPGWQQLHLPPGCRVTQLVAGLDFTAALVSKEEPSLLDSPDGPAAALPGSSTDSCPLGLALNTSSPISRSRAVRRKVKKIETEPPVAVESVFDEVDGDCTGHLSKRTGQMTISSVSAPGQLGGLEQSLKDVSEHSDILEMISTNDKPDSYDDIKDEDIQIQAQIPEDFEVMAMKYPNEVSTSDHETLPRPTTDKTESALAGYMTSLGKSVWAGSLSLLSTTAAPTPTSATSLAESSARPIKSRSEPPTQSSPPSPAKPSKREPRKEARAEAGLEAVQTLGARLLGGSVLSWGAGRRGQLGQGDTLARATPSPLTGLQGRLVHLAAGNTHCLALTDTGAVWGWG